MPVIEHHDFSFIELKNMGGAMAASGAVALFHVEGVTPEAPNLKTVFDGEPEKTITITQKDLDSLQSNSPNEAGMVVFGCPQMTCEEVLLIADRFHGKHVRIPTWFCMVPAEIKRFEQTDAYHKIVEAGVEVFTHCPLAALSVQASRKVVLTNSGKLYYYLEGSEYGTPEDCLRACGV